MKTIIHSCKSTGVNVDWLTTTASTKACKQTLWELGHRVMSAGEIEGEKTTRWHANGYSGWSSAGVAFGERADSVILRLSSSKAAEEWVEAAAAGENFTRLDIAVDTELDPPVTRLARDVYRDTGHVPSRNGRPPKRTFITSSDGGVTAYVGSRVSENFGRLYDKGIEQKTHTAGKWWRWEVELKGDMANAGMTSMLQAPNSRLWQHAFVASWFRRRTRHVFPAAPLDFNHIGPLKATSDEVRLQWLSRGVRPTVQDLIERVGRQRVLFALGLSCNAAVNERQSA